MPEPDPEQARPAASRPDDAARANELTFLGGVSLKLMGRAIALTSQKIQALLAFLALDGTRAASRERLCGLLWSEFDEEKARASLRQAMHGLRSTAGPNLPDILEVSRASIGLRPGLTTDVAEILAGLEGGGVDGRLLDRKRLADALLQGLDDIDPSFRIWLLVQRQALAEKLARGLEGLLDGGGEVARDAAVALLNLDPTHERACRHAMRDAALAGDVAAALRLYKRLWDLLEEEYGTEPSEPTQALVVQIKNGVLRPDPAPAPTPGAAPAGPPTARDHPYLLVSAFEILGADERLGPIAGGLRHELIAKLVRFREWSVLDRATSTVDPASLPGRAYSIDATLRQLGEALSLTLTVKEQPTGLYIWSESSAIEPQRWFAIEPALVRRIAMAVNIHLTADRLAKIAGTPDVSLNVYERWLRGQKILNEFTASADARSAAIFRSLVEEAPDFSPAYSSLAQGSNTRHLAYPGLRRTGEDLAEALRYAGRAVQIDPFDSRAHLAHGWALAFHQRWERAETAFDLALKLNDNDPWTLTSVALATAFCGRHDASVELASQALALRPQPPAVHWAYHATLRFLCGDCAGAADAAERAEGAISNVPGWHAAALALLGEREAARARAHLFLDMMRRQWHGAAPTDTEIVDWFLGAFPIRLEADRVRLSDGLEQALSP